MIKTNEMPPRIKTTKGFKKSEIRSIELYPIPTWMKDSPDKQNYIWDQNWKFWYQTQEDYRSGVLKDHELYRISSSFVVKDYTLHNGYVVSAFRKYGKAWLDLYDAWHITGVNPSEITGVPINFVDGSSERIETIPVRGASGYLTPDEIISVNNGFSDIALIRLEAFIGFLRKISFDEKVTNFLSLVVIPDIYSDNQAGSNKDTHLDIHEARQYSRGKPMYGQLRMVRLGTKVWITVRDLSTLTALDAEAIIKIAGGQGTAVIANKDISDQRDGAEVYVLYESAELLLRAMGKIDWAEKLIERISNDILAPASLMESGAFVSASLLDAMLGHDPQFRTWVGNLIDDAPEHDFDIPITVAYQIAQFGDKFLSLVTSKLLSDSGFFHNGTIDESPDETFRRFQDLIPDSDGLVDSRKALEFMGCPLDYNHWSNLYRSWAKLKSYRISHVESRIRSCYLYSRIMNLPISGDSE